jgi:ubiquitin C-terminal hydrolase
MDSTIDIPKIGLCGLNNMGNTCYLNSVLQLLIHSKVFLSFLLQDDKNYSYYLEQASIRRLGKLYRKKHNLTENDQATIKRSDIDKLMKYSITEKLYEIVHVILNKGNSLITPVGFKEILDLKTDDFRRHTQHDPQELLIKILENIEEETGIKTNIFELTNETEFYKKYKEILINYDELLKNNEKKLLEISEINERILFNNILNNYKMQYRNIINQYNGLTFAKNIFNTKFNSFIFNTNIILVKNVICSVCNNVNVTYETKTILELEICDTIHDSFVKLTNNEQLLYHTCDICKSYEKSEKNLKIWKPPLLLFIHLTRFKQTSFNKVSKNKSFIDIPKEINISEFYDNSIIDSFKVNKYILKGIINHHGGSLNSGHYTADCISINDNSWYHFNDSDVSKYSGNNIDISAAYVLMYEINFN